MSLTNCFTHLFQRSHGEDPANMLNAVRGNRLTQYHIDATGYTKEFLQPFVAEINCAVVFHSNDGWITNDRIGFIDNLPASASKTDVVIVDSQFPQAELKRYGGRDVTVQVCDQNSRIGHMFKLLAYARNFPGQVQFRANAYSRAQILHILKSANIKCIVHQGDLTSKDIIDIIDLYKSAVHIERSGYQDDELNDLRAKGAVIIREAVA